MKITIIVPDMAVYKDGLCYSKLTWGGTPINIHALQFDTEQSVGWIEFNNGLPNEIISELPDWANNAMAEWQIAYDNAHKPPLPPEPPTADDNKAKAVSLLQQTDYAELPSVSDPAQSNPYLNNKDEFIAYRSKVRETAVTPVAGDISWPVMPQGDWVKL